MGKGASFGVSAGDVPPSSASRPLDLRFGHRAAERSGRTQACSPSELMDTLKPPRRLSPYPQRASKMFSQREDTAGNRQATPVCVSRACAPCPRRIDYLQLSPIDRHNNALSGLALYERSLYGTPFGYSRRLLSYRALRPVNGNRIVSLSTPALPATVGWCVDSFPGLPARDVYCSGDRIRGDLAPGGSEPRAIGLNHLHLSPHPARAPPTPSRRLFLSQRLPCGSRRGEGTPARYPWRVHPRPGHWLSLQQPLPPLRAPQNV